MMVQKMMILENFLDNQDAPASEKIQIPDDLVKN